MEGNFTPFRVKLLSTLVMTTNNAKLYLSQKFLLLFYVHRGIEKNQKKSIWRLMEKIRIPQPLSPTNPTVFALPDAQIHAIHSPDNLCFSADERPCHEAGLNVKVFFYIARLKKWLAIHTL